MAIIDPITAHRKQKPVLCGACLATSVLLSSCTTMPSEEAMRNQQESVHQQQAQDGSLRQSLGLENSWQPIDKKGLELIEEWKPMTIKVIFEHHAKNGTVQYLADSKRSLGKKRFRKDQLWEFPGGHVDEDETATDAMIRELKEEDPSGILGARIEKVTSETNSEASYKNIKIKNGEHHTIVRTSLETDDAMKLQSSHLDHEKSSSEVYHFLWLTTEQLDTRKPAFAALWTPKSRKLLKGLRSS